MSAVVNYLAQVEKKVEDVARDRYVKLARWLGHPQEYRLDIFGTDFDGYEGYVVDILKRLL